MSKQEPPPPNASASEPDTSASPFRPRVISSVRWTALSAAVTVIAQLAQLIVVARVLSPRSFGVIAILLVVVGLAQVYSDLGLSAALIYRRDDTSAERSSLYWANVLAGTVIFILAVAAAPLVATAFRDDSIAPYLRVSALLLLIIPFGQQFRVLLEKELGFRLVGSFETAGAIVNALATIVLVLFGTGIWGFIAGTIIGQAVTTGAYAWVGWSRFRPTLRLRWTDVQSYMGFGLYQLGERTLNYLSQRADQFLVAAMFGPAALGFYNFASNITSQLASRVNPIVTRVAFPVLAAAQDDLPRLRRGFLNMVELLTAVNAPVLLGLIAIAPNLIPAIFGRKWAMSISLVQLLAVAALTRSIVNPIGSLQNARGRADLGFLFNVIALVLVVPSVALGGELDGTIGVAIAVTVDQIVLLSAGFSRLIKPLADLDLRPYLLSFMRPITLAGLMATIVYVAGALIPGVSNSVRLAVQVVVGVASYFTLLWLLNRNTLIELASVVGVRLTRPSLGSPRRQTGDVKR